MDISLINDSIFKSGVSSIEIEFLLTLLLLLSSIINEDKIKDIKDENNKINDINNIIIDNKDIDDNLLFLILMDKFIDDDFAISPNFFNYFII